MHGMSHLFLSLVNNIIDGHREKLKGLVHPKMKISWTVEQKVICFGGE